MVSAVREQVKILDVSDIGGLQLLQASYRSQRFNRHSHDGYGFGVVERGTLCFRYLGADSSAPTGMINLVCPGECHDGYGKTREGWSYRMFYIAPELVAAIIGDGRNKSDTLPFFRTGVIEDDALAAQFVLAHRYITEKPNDNLAIEDLVSGFICSMVNAYGDEKLRLPKLLSASTQIQRVVDKLEDEFQVNHRLEDLSSLAGISKYHLIRVFANETGLTPHKYLNQVRIQRSEQLLRQGVDLAETAYRTGFADQSHFTRTFRSIKGIAPGAFRNFVQDVRH